MIIAQDIMLAVLRDDCAERRGHKVTVLWLTADRAAGSSWPHTSSLRRFEHNKTACLNDIGSNVAYTLGKTKFFWDDLLVDFAFDVKTNGVIAGRFSFDKLVSDADSDNVVFRVRQGSKPRERGGTPRRKIPHRVPFRRFQFTRDRIPRQL